MGRKNNHSSQLALDFGGDDFHQVPAFVPPADLASQLSSHGDSDPVGQHNEPLTDTEFEVLFAPTVTTETKATAGGPSESRTFPLIPGIATSFVFQPGSHGAGQLYGVNYGAEYHPALRPSLSIALGNQAPLPNVSQSNGSSVRSSTNDVHEELEAGSQSAETELIETSKTDDSKARVGAAVEALRYATPAKIKATREGLKNYGSRCLRDRVQLPKQRESDDLCLDQLANEAKVERILLDLPELAHEVGRLVATIGIEVITPEEESLLERLRDLWRTRKAAGLGLPAIKKGKAVSYHAVGTLLGLVGYQLIRTRPVWRLIDDMAADLGLIVKSTKAQVRGRLWIAQQRQEGRKIPALRAYPKRPWMQECARRIGLHLNQARQIKAELNAAGAELGYELMDHAPRVSDYPLCITIRKWAEVRIQESRPCPRNRYGNISNARIKQETGIPLARLKSVTYRKFLGELMEKVGLEPAFQPVTVTLERLLTESQQFYRLQLEKAAPKATSEEDAKVRKAAIDSEIRNLRYHLNQLINVQPQRGLAHARPALEQARASKETKGKYKQELGIAWKCLLSLEANDSLPLDISDAIDVACARQGMTMRQASLASDNPHNFAGLLKNRFPMSTSQIPRIHKLEAVLRLTKDALVKKVQFQSIAPVKIAVARFPDFVRRNYKLRCKLLLLLRDEDANLPDDAFTARVFELVAVIEKREEGLRQTLHRRVPNHSLPELPPLVSEQFLTLCRAVSTSSGQRTAALGSAALRPGSKRWSAATIAMKEMVLRRYFGFLSTSEPGRDAVTPEVATLALAVFPRLTLQYPLWLMNNRDRPDDAKSIKSDFSIIEEFRSWLTPDGLLTQQPHLAKTLRPVGGAISDDDIARVQADWAKACREAYEYYTKLWEARPTAGNNKSLKAIMPILKLKDPSIVVKCMIEAVSAERRKLAEGSVPWAILLRNEIYLHIQLRFAFRSSTILSLTADMISTRANDIKWIDVSRRLIKNGHTKTFKLGDNWIDYTRPINDAYGSYEAIDLYLNEGRQVLLQGKQDHGFLMIALNGDNMNRLWEFNFKLSSQYLQANPKAPPVARDMLPLFNHAFRHIVACSVGRSSGWAMAAWVLMDSEPTVREFYGFIEEDDMNEQYFDMVMAAHKVQPTGDEQCA